MMKPGVFLTNVEQEVEARSHFCPDLPSRHRRETLCVDEWAKVRAEHENEDLSREIFWVRITSVAETIHGRVYEGVVDNTLFFTCHLGLQYGDKISFLPENVMDAMRPPATTQSLP